MSSFLGFVLSPECRILSLSMEQLNNESVLVSKPMTPKQVFRAVPRPRYVEIMKQLVELTVKMAVCFGNNPMIWDKELEESAKMFDEADAIEVLTVFVNGINAGSANLKGPANNCVVGIDLKTGDVALIDEKTQRGCWVKCMVVGDSYADDLVAIRR